MARLNSNGGGGMRAGAMVAMVAALALAGCAVGPDYLRPETRIDLPADFVSAEITTGPGDLTEWWRDFGSTELDEFVDEALRYNHSLAAAAGRVLEARAQLGGSKSARWPSLNLATTAVRARSNIDTPLGRDDVYADNYEAAGSASYEIDLWGRLSRAREASFASLLASEEDRRTVKRTLVADVVRTWLETRDLECQLDLLRRTVGSYEKNLQIVEDRYRHGVTSSLDLHMTRQLLQSTRAQIPANEQQLASARRRLEVLAGRYPSGLASADGEGCALPTALPPIPAAMPADVLGMRPDVRAAEARLRAATATIGSAKAGLYPRLSLTGSGGWASGELTDFVSEGNAIWSLLGNLTMPLINRGATKAQIAAAEARRDQAVANWRGTVLGALAEAENALTAEKLQTEQRDLLADATEQARLSLTLAEDRYRRGLSGLLVLLDTQRSLLQAESGLIQADRLRCSARVNLILALGGPWDETTDASSGATETDAPSPDEE